MLAGYFNPGQAKTACANLPGNKRADFKIVWYGRGGLTLNAADCKLRFTNEVNGCSMGGRTGSAGWGCTSVALPITLAHGPLFSGVDCQACAYSTFQST